MSCTHQQMGFGVLAVAAAAGLGSSLMAVDCLTTTGTYANRDHGNRTLIINEWNAVGADKELGDDGVSTEYGCDPFWLQVDGNGGNWIEFVVVGNTNEFGWNGSSIQNTVDLRNVIFQWRNADPSSGYFRFEDDAVWSAVPVGTIIVVIENNGSAPAEDTTTAPGSGNWNMLVHHNGAYVDVVTDSFKADNDDWQLRIIDIDRDITEEGALCLIQEPVGEAAEGWAGGGISSREVGHLEANPSNNVLVGTYDDNDFSDFGCPNRWGQGDTCPYTATSIQNFQVLRRGSASVTSSGGQYLDTRCGNSLDFNPSPGAWSWATNLNAAWYDPCIAFGCP